MIDASSRIFRSASSCTKNISSYRLDRCSARRDAAFAGKSNDSLEERCNGSDKKVYPLLVEMLSESDCITLLASVRYIQGFSQAQLSNHVSVEQTVQPPYFDTVYIYSRTRVGCVVLWLLQK